MKVVERGKHFRGTDGQYYACFDSVEVKEGGVLIGTHGNGKTRDSSSHFKVKDL